MKINRNNYEIYFLDYYEDNLNQEQARELMTFIELNPDLKEEFYEFEMVKLEDDKGITFPTKSSLKKNIQEESRLINASNYQNYFISYIEGNLNKEESKLVMQFVNRNPEYAKELDRFKKTKVVADESIVFPDKNKLKHYVIEFGKVYRYVSAAAVIILLTGLFFLFRNNINNRGGQLSVVSNQQSAVSGQRSAVSGQRSAISGQRSAVSGQQSAISNQQSAISSQQSAISGQRSAVSGQQSAISNQQSAISNQQSAISSHVEKSNLRLSSGQEVKSQELEFKKGNSASYIASAEPGLIKMKSLSPKEIIVTNDVRSGDEELLAYKPIQNIKTNIVNEDTVKINKNERLNKDLDDKMLAETEPIGKQIKEIISKEAFNAVGIETLPTPNPEVKRNKIRNIWDVVFIGTKVYNKLLKKDVKLDERFDAKGELAEVSFESNIISFEKKINK